MKSFTEAVQEFVDNNKGWLGPDHVVAIATLYHTANELDTQVANGKINPPLLTAFGLAYRNLLKERANEPEEVDPITAMLQERKNK